ncbi:inorganic diphosphatase, partial [Buchnera aphidicola]|nr:inorganic diphosphatase [Buchnera aphidicola]
MIAGKNIPYDIYVIIEIPAHSHPVKYEMNKKYNMLFVDRFIPTPMFYPCNYGYINQTLALDGDPLDVLVPSPYPIQSNTVIHCKPVGMLKMCDE